MQEVLHNHPVVPVFFYYRFLYCRIHSPLLGDKVNYGIGLWSHRASQPMFPDGPVRQPYAIVNFITLVRAYELSLWQKSFN